MRIAYVANHGRGDLDDEGAIAHALRMLGHKVLCVPERTFSGSCPRADFLLCHHINRDSRSGNLAAARMPVVFWCFDLTEFPDAALAERNAHRVRWIKEMTELCTVGFMTDGDWVAKDTSGKLVWLLQGFDDRVAAQPYHPTVAFDLLLTAAKWRCGDGRNQFIRDVLVRYGARLRHLTSGAYREDLAALIARAKVVLCPDAPVSDRYWSNRVWWSTGLAGFTLHPYCARLAEMYEHDKEIVYYTTRDNLYSKIEYALQNPDYCRKVAEAGRVRTLAQHTYRHRCEVLIRTVRERLGVVPAV